MLEQRIDMVSRTVYTEVEVDVDLTYFETEDLIDELENRGHMSDTSSKEIVEAIYQNRRQGKDFSEELDQLIYTVLGKIA
jgi:polyhydroxyalkanoate synthesis regulator phasin